jgi:glucokinase
VKIAIDEAPNESVAAVGIATAGMVDSQEGAIIGSTGNLPAIKGIVPLKRVLEDRLHLPVHVENDANAAAYGEMVAGGAKGFRTVLMVTLGTGVGTGIVVNGSMLRGAHYSAGESGHIALSLERQRACTCGRWDCWEAYASGPGLKQTADAMLEHAPKHHPSPLKAKQMAEEYISTHDIIAAFNEGDPLAKDMLDLWHSHIAVGLGSLINVLDPEVVVIGGGMAPFVDFNKLSDRTLERAMPKSINIVPATLGNRAGILGAAFLALKETASTH